MTTSAKKENQPLLPLYAILGEQSFLREQALDRLKTRVAEVGDIDFNFDHFDAQHADPEAIVAAANTIPFASAYRLVIVNNIHLAKKNVLDGLAAYAQEPSQTTVLAIVGEKLLKSSKLYKAINAVGGIVERSNPKLNELPAIVQSLFAAHHKKASITICSSLVSSVGQEIEALNTAVTKIVTYMGDRQTATSDDVEAVVQISAQIKVWDIATALQTRDCTSALQTLSRLLSQGSSLHMIHPVIVKTVRDILVARSLIDSGETSGIERALGLPAWIARRVVEAAHRYSAEELRAALENLAQLEWRLKTSQDGAAHYKRWLLDFCQS